MESWMRQEPVDAANARSLLQTDSSRRQTSRYQACRHLWQRQAAIQGIQGSADENGMVSAASLNAVIGMLGNSASGVSGVDAVQNNVENMDASAYTAQAQQIADAAAGQLAGVQETLNGTAGQLNAAAEGLKKEQKLLAQNQEK